jgi:cytochrome c oxidase subunit 1
VWAQFVTSFLLLLAFPPARSGRRAAVDGQGGRAPAFSCPTGLVVGNQPLAISGGGNPLMWQHLFWFLAHRKSTC